MHLCYGGRETRATSEIGIIIHLLSVEEDYVLSIIMSITYFVILNSSIKCKKRYHLINWNGRSYIVADINEKLNGNYKIILPVTRNGIFMEYFIFHVY